MASKLKFQKYRKLEYWNLEGQTFDTTLGYFLFVIGLLDLIIPYQYELNYHHHKTEFKNIN